MASKSLGTLTLDLIAKIGGFVGPMDKASRASKKTSDDISKNIKSASKAAALLGLGAATGFAVMVKHSIDLQDEISKSSQKIGIAVEDLSALKYTADLAGVSFEELEGSLGKFSKNIGETFATGVGAAADAFSDLGIKVTDSSGKLKSTIDLFDEVSDRLSGLEDGAVKTAVSMDLFGKSGKDLIPLLNAGSAGIRDSADEAKRLGQIFSTEGARSAEEFNDNLSRLEASITGVANASASAVVGDLADLTNALQDPQTQESIAALAAVLAGLSVTAVKALASLGGLVNFLTADLDDAANAAVEDIAFLEKQLQETMDKTYAIQFSVDFIDNKQTESQLEQLYKDADRISKRLEAAKQKRDAVPVVPDYAAGVSNNPFALTQEQIEYNRKLKESNKKLAEDQAAAAKELQKHFEDTRNSLQKEIDLYGLSSNAASIAYETKKGELKGLTQAHKDELIALAEQKDANEHLLELAQSRRDVDLAAMGKNGSLASVQMEYDLKTKLLQVNNKLSEQDIQREQALINNKKLEEHNNFVNDFNEQLKQQQRSIDLYGVSSEAAKAEYDIRNGILHVEGGITSEQAQQYISNQQRLDALEQIKSFTELTAEATERIDESFANAWENIDEGFTGLRDGILGSFKTMLAEMAHQALTKPIAIKLQQIMTGSSLSALGSNATAGVGGTSGVADGAEGVSSLGGSALASGGIYAAGALAVIAAVKIWNEKQDEKFVKMTAEYKQGNQSLSKVLGEGNKKSESINESIDLLKAVNGDVLNVNNDMLDALLNIRLGIDKVAAGFAKTLVGGADYKALGISEGTKGLGDSIPDVGNILTHLDPLNNAMTQVGRFVTEFGGAVNKKILNGIYNKKSKVIDSGIEVIGKSLADIITGSTLEAFNYADVQTTKKFLGVTTSQKVKRSREDLDSVFEEQFTDVFRSAGEALDIASEAFGINFDDFTSQLNVKAQDLSLKGLEGDALTKEINSFFGATLDGWAEVLLGGSSVLVDFQQVGESAFETMLRLSSETNTFGDYAEKLGLNFNLIGEASVYATQAIAELSGGFDSLSSNLAAYYDKFFSDSDKFVELQGSLGQAFADLGYALPKTRDEFKGYIKDLNLSTEADEERFAALIKLTNATDGYLTALENETKTRADAQKQLEESQSEMQQALRDKASGAFDAFSKSIDGDMKKVQESLSASRQVADSLTNALRGMRLESSQNDLTSRRIAQSKLIAANAISKAGGGLPTAGELDGILSALAQPSQDMFSTFEEYALDFYKTQKNIKELSEVATGKATIEEQNLDALQSALDYYQQQLDALNGIDNGVLTVADAVSKLTVALKDAGVVFTDAAPELPALSNEYEVAQNKMYSSALTKTTSPTTAQNAIQAQSLDSFLDSLKDLFDHMQAGQFAIASNTLDTANVLTKWDKDGMPAERVL